MTTPMREQDNAELYVVLDGLRERIDDLIERVDWAEARQARLENAIAIAITILHPNVSLPHLVPLRELLIKALEGTEEPVEAEA